MREIVHELGLATRALRRSPGHAILATLILACGLGLTLFMFGAINAYVLKPLPYPEETFLQENLHDLDRLFQEGDLFLAALAQLLDQHRAEFGVSNTQNLQNDGDDALEIELGGQFDLHPLQRAEQPAQEALLEVLPYAAAELFEAFYDGVD